MVDMYHFYLRQYQYRKFRPAVLADPPNTSEEEDAVVLGVRSENDASKRRERARLLLRFAVEAILSEVHERRRRWTWEFFEERRDDRKRYVELYKKRESAPAPSLSPSVSFVSFLQIGLAQ